MDLAEIGLWAVSGAIAAGVASLLFHRNESRTKYIITLLVVLFAVSSVLRVAVLPRVKHWSHEREADKALDSLPVYRLLAKHEPQLYQQLRHTLIDGMDKGETASAVTAKMIAPLSAILPKYISKASDDAVVRFAGAVNDGVRTLSEKDADACYQFLYPDQFRAQRDPSQYLPESAKEEQLSILAAVIETATTSPQTPPESSHAQALLRNLQVELAQTWGDDLQLLARTPVNTAERKKVCDITGEMFTRILKLPPPDGSILLRHLLATRS